MPKEIKKTTFELRQWSRHTTYMGYIGQMTALLLQSQTILERVATPESQLPYSSIRLFATSPMVERWSIARRWIVLNDSDSESC